MPIRLPQIINHPTVSPPDASQSREQRMARLQANMHWFEAHRESLAGQFPGASYVAVWREEPVIVGDSLLEVAEEFYGTFGHEPVYIGRISGEPDVETFSSPLSDLRK
jgi:hypothetical protein